MLKQTYEGVDSFPLMAVPFFILAAELMSGGSLTEVLLKFAAQFVGHKRGGLGYTNVVSLTFFSGISGSALADAAGPGSMMIKHDGQGRLRPRLCRGADRRHGHRRAHHPALDHHDHLRAAGRARVGRARCSSPASCPAS